jgi:hypothetical protein
MEPNPIILLSPGSSVRYAVKGIDGMSDAHHDLTHNQYLKITSSDEDVSPSYWCNKARPLTSQTQFERTTDVTETDVSCALRCSVTNAKETVDPL